MIPQLLSLTYFICYRRATLDFAGIHVACLAGENGAGKSALLDAITWAVWGKSRARRDDELIHGTPPYPPGGDEMAVEFTFDLGDQAYRVLRRRRAGKRGSSLLDFQIQDDRRWRSIAESGVRATQEKIQRVLRLDYDTFINSAFLRQGRADEFTVKTAAERKRVLGDILGLDRWAEYEERARGRLRDIRAEAEVIELRLQEINGELARRPQYEAQLQEARHLRRFRPLTSRSRQRGQNCDTLKRRSLKSLGGLLRRNKTFRLCLRNGLPERSDWPSIRVWQCVQMRLRQDTQPISKRLTRSGSWVPNSTSRWN